MPSDKTAGHRDRAGPAARARCSSRARRCGSTSPRGPKPVAVPTVVGSSYEIAAAQLQAAGFTVGAGRRRERPPGRRGRRPDAGGQLDRRARIDRDALRLEGADDRRRSRRHGLQTVADARQTLRAAGFKVTIATSDTEDESLDGLVVVAETRSAARRRDPDSIGGDRRSGGSCRRRRDDGDRPTRPRRTRPTPAPVSPRLRVAVLAGGRSSEHEISLASAASIAAALDPERYDVHTIEIGRDGRWELPAGDHPRAGRDDAAETLPVPTDWLARRRWRRSTSSSSRSTGRSARTGRCRACSSSRTSRTSGPGVLASALCMDKDVFKQVMRAQGIPVARHVALRLGDAITNPFGYPVFVKPAGSAPRSGSRRCGAEDELETAVALAWRHDEKVLVEEFVAGHGDRGRGARQPPGSAGVAPGSGRVSFRRLVRLLVEVRRGRLRARHPAARPLGGADRAGPARRGRRPSSPRIARAWRARTSSCASRTARS